jgi:ATP-dependent DNA helicase Q1
MASWTTDDTDALARCGHCDNCMRPPETVDQRDVTVEAWQILKIAAAVQRQGGRLTLNGLSDLARGAGGSAFDTGGTGKGKAKERTTLDLADVAGGKIGLSKDVSFAEFIHIIFVQ